MSAARSFQLILARAAGGSGVSRRQSLILAAGTLGGALAASLAPLPRAARAEEDPERHGISAFGDLQYPPDFGNFDYVDPQAPKGGTFSQIGPSIIFNQNFLTRSTVSSCAATPRREWS